ncbi:RNA polymerase sigma factor [Ktedonosporobacter rubrisoli]
MQPGSEDILTLLATDLDCYYEQLVALYWRQLYVFVLRRARSPQDAEDIVQEAFVRAYLALQRYSAQRILCLKLRPWLYKVAWSVYCNYTGRSKSPPSMPLEGPARICSLSWKMLKRSSQKSSLSMLSKGASLRNW